MKESELEDLVMMLKTALRPMSIHQLEEQTRYNQDQLETRLEYLERQGRVTHKEKNFQTVWWVEDDEEED